MIEDLLREVRALQHRIEQLETQDTLALTVDGTGLTVIPNGTVTVTINGVTYFLLTAAAS